ncbi:MAG: hypothetical protein AAFY45_25365 [Bacteroidota bacterium]
MQTLFRFRNNSHLVNSSPNTHRGAQNLFQGPGTGGIMKER